LRIGKITSKGTVAQCRSDTKRTDASPLNLEGRRFRPGGFKIGEKIRKSLGFLERRRLGHASQKREREATRRMVSKSAGGERAVIMLLTHPS